MKYVLRNASALVGIGLVAAIAAVAVPRIFGDPRPAPVPAVAPAVAIRSERPGPVSIAAPGGGHPMSEADLNRDLPREIEPGAMLRGIRLAVPQGRSRTHLVNILEIAPENLAVARAGIRANLRIVERTACEEGVPLSMGGYPIWVELRLPGGRRVAGMPYTDFICEGSPSRE